MHVARLELFHLTKQFFIMSIVRRFIASCGGSTLKKYFQSVHLRVEGATASIKVVFQNHLSQIMYFKL